MKFYIYAFYEPDCANPFYIGKGSGNRHLKHFYPEHLFLTDMFHNKLRSMLLNDIQPIIKILFKNLTEQEAFDLEIRLIAQYGRRDNNTGCLCNMTDGGEGQSGRLMSNETRIKCGNGSRGRVIDYDERIKRSQVAKGKKKSKEMQIKRIKTRIEKYSNPIESYDLSNQQTIKIYQSISEAVQDGFNHPNIVACLRGRRRHHMKLGWRYHVKKNDCIINPNSWALKDFENNGYTS